MPRIARRDRVGLRRDIGPSAFRDARSARRARSSVRWHGRRRSGAVAAPRGVARCAAQRLGAVRRARVGVRPAILPPLSSHRRRTVARAPGDSTARRPRLGNAARAGHWTRAGRALGVGARYRGDRCRRGPWPSLRGRQLDFCGRRLRARRRTARGKRCSGAAAHAPPDARRWRCVLALPAGDPGVSGDAEVGAFARLPLPSSARCGARGALGAHGDPAGPGGRGHCRVRTRADRGAVHYRPLVCRSAGGCIRPGTQRCAGSCVH